MRIKFKKVNPELNDNNRITSGMLRPTDVPRGGSDLYKVAFSWWVGTNMNANEILPMADRDFKHTHIKQVHRHCIK